MKQSEIDNIKDKLLERSDYKFSVHIVLIVVTIIICGYITYKGY